MIKMLLILGFITLLGNSYAQITTSEVKVEQTGNLTTINGQTTISGIITSNGLKIPDAFTLGVGHSPAAIEIQLSPGSYNAFRAFNDSQGIGTIHFFDDTWNSGNPSNSAGAINLDAHTAVTLGPWNNPTAYFRESDGFVGIGTENPAHRLSVTGGTQTQGIRIPGRYTFGQHQSAIEMEIPTNSYNAIRGFNGSQSIGSIHFFDDTWYPGDPSQSAGSINLDGGIAVTLGPWNNPTAYFRRNDGFVGIGIENPTEKLHVNGNIRANAPIWSDFVFEDDYQLRSLEEVEEHIIKKGHLPEIPSELEVAENGINLGEMDAKLLQKIEELTLYMIDINKKLKSQSERVKQLESENSELKEKVKHLANE